MITNQMDMQLSAIQPQDPVTEIGILLGETEFAALQVNANSEGITVGTLIRQILGESLRIGRNQQARNSSTSVSSNTPCLGGCRPKSAHESVHPLRMLRSCEWEFLETVRETLEQAGDPFQVCREAVRLAVPILGQGCNIVLANTKTGENVNWRTPNWSSNAEMKPTWIRSLFDDGRQVGMISFFGRMSLDSWSFQRVTQLFANIVARSFVSCESTHNDHRKLGVTSLATELRNRIESLGNEAAMIGYLGLHSHRGRVGFRQIEREISQLRSLLTGVVDCYRFEHGEVELNFQWVDLEVVLDRVARSIEPLILEKQNRLTPSLPSDLGFFWADPGCIGQILLQLLTNFVRNQSPRSEIFISALRDDHHVKIRVRDQTVEDGANPQPQLMSAFQNVITDQLEGNISDILIHRLVLLHGGSYQIRENDSGTRCEYGINFPVRISGRDAGAGNAKC